MNEFTGESGCLLLAARGCCLGVADVGGRRDAVANFLDGRRSQGMAERGACRPVDLTADLGEEQGLYRPSRLRVFEGAPVGDGDRLGKGVWVRKGGGGRRKGKVGYGGHGFES